MPLCPTVHHCRSENLATIKGRSDLTVEYLDTSSEVERYLDPSTIRSLHRTSKTWNCRLRRTCPAIGSHLWCGRHAPQANWQAHICTCEHITRTYTRARGVHTHTPAEPHALSAHGRTHHASTCCPFESGCAALRFQDRTFKRSQSSFRMNSYCVSGYFHELPTAVRYFANSMDQLLKDMAIYYPSLYISDVQIELDDDIDPIDMDWD